MNTDGGSERIIPAYLNIVHPYTVDYKLLEKQGLFLDDAVKEIAYDDYDGIIVKNAMDDESGELRTMYIVPTSEQAKLVTNLNPTADPDIRYSIRDVAERFNPANEDIRYSRMDGGGYSGYSMSNRAVAAYEDGEKPLSKWTKAEILGAIADELGQEKANMLKGIRTDVLKRKLLYNSSWHHTSLMYNKTEFYAVDFEKVDELTQDDIEKMLAAPVEQAPAPKTYKGSIDYLEWTGTRNHPKAIKHRLEDVNIEERGSFYIITDDDGKEILRKKIGSNGTFVKKAESEGSRYSIRDDINGETYVDIQEDIFDGRGETFAKVIAETISERFNNLITANKQSIQINQTTNKEWRRSPNAQKLIRDEPDKYYDKLKAIANADEILTAAKRWVGEAVEHERNDKIVEFARGVVNLKVGKNGYSADVLVATKENGSAVLYDILNMKEKNITEAQVSGGKQVSSSILDAPVTNNTIPQENNSVKQKNSRPDTGKISADYKAVMAENAHLREAVELLKKELTLTDGHEVSRKSVMLAAKRLLKVYNSKYDVEMFADRLTSLYNYIANNRQDISGDMVVDMAAEIARDVVEQAREKVNHFEDEAADIKKMLKQPIYLSEEFRGDAAHHYGSYEAYRRRMFGKVNYICFPRTDTPQNSTDNAAESGVERNGLHRQQNCHRARNP